MNSIAEVQHFDLVSLRQSADTAALHPQSLLNIPLVRKAFCDVGFQLVERSTDSRWKYASAIPVTTSGFNPFIGCYFYGQSSQISQWLTQPFGSARELNDSDILVREVLFMAHDYLHAWTYRMIDQLHPEMRVLNGEISNDNFDDYIFCHLLSEAVATTGLDYWFLSLHDVNELCDLGSGVGPLTVSYQEAFAPEYRKFCPELEVQNPKFLGLLIRFYCTGEFPGFSGDDLRRSPKLLSWLEHELSYGARQRQVTREWLSYLSGTKINLPEDYSSALDPDTDLRTRLVEDLQELLWALIKETSDDSPAHSGIQFRGATAVRQAPRDKRPDFRFLNLACIPESEWPAGTEQSEESFRHFVFQYLAQIPFESVPNSKLRYIPLVLQHRDMDLLRELFGNLPRLGKTPHEPRDIFLIN